MNRVTVFDFREDNLFVFENNDGIFVAIKNLSDKFGINWKYQQTNLKKDPLLSEYMTIIVISLGFAEQEIICLPLCYINRWLFGIEKSRVKPEMRERLLDYQRDCYDVLADHFLGPRVVGQPIRAPSTVEDAKQRAEEHKLDMVREMRLIAGPAKAYALWRKLGLEDDEAKVAPPSVASQVLERDFLADVAARSLQNIAEAYGTWTGTPAQLLAEMEKEATPIDRRNMRWPRNAQALGTALKRVAPLLEHRGIAIEYEHAGIRSVTLRVIED